MDHNLTIESSSLENYSINFLDYVNDVFYKRIHEVEPWPASLLPFLIIPGLFLNILAFAILVRRQLCLEHEGFVYFGGIQLVNVAVIAYDLIPFWISSFSPYSNNILITSDASCKVLIHVDHVLTSASGWLAVAALFDVYLRRRRAQSTEKKICGCTHFPSKYCTLFGAGFTTGSIFFQLIVGCLWLIPFTEFVGIKRMEYCHIDLPSSYSLFVFAVERFPVLVLTPVLLIALAYIALGRGEYGASYDAMEESISSDAKDFTKATIGVATASLLLKSPLFIIKSILPRDALHRSDFRFNLIFFGLTALSLVNLVVMPVVCLATLSGMRQAIASITRSRCTDRRSARRVTP